MSILTKSLFFIHFESWICLRNFLINIKFNSFSLSDFTNLTSPIYEYFIIEQTLTSVHECFSSTRKQRQSSEHSIDVINCDANIILLQARAHVQEALPLSNQATFHK